MYTIGYRGNTVPTLNDLTIYNNSVVYKCKDWPKYISRRRLRDQIKDCYYGDDENGPFPIINCPIEENDNYFKCSNNTCIPSNEVNNGRCDCEIYDGRCSDEQYDVLDIGNTIPFQKICDGRLDLGMHLSEDDDESDEDNCQYWPVTHIYNRCDGIWNFPNGSDELNCYSTPLINCSITEHICVSQQTNQLICLPIEKANDGIIDCFGAADEPTYCQSSLGDPFYCPNNTRAQCIPVLVLCDKNSLCSRYDYEEACQKGNSIISRIVRDTSNDYDQWECSDTAKVLCRTLFNF